METRTTTTGENIMSYSTLQAYLSALFGTFCILLAQTIGKSDLEVVIATTLLVTTIVMMIIVDGEIKKEMRE